MEGNGMSKWKRTSEHDWLFPGETKVFRRGSLTAAVSIENGLYHISISHPTRLPKYEELKSSRYKLVPDNIYMAQIFPPSKDFVNKHKYCLHLWQFHPNELQEFKGIAI